MKILKGLTLILLFLSSIFFAYSFVVAQINPGYDIVYQLSKFLFILLLVVYIILYFFSLSREPFIKKREIVTELDTDPLRQQSFPATFTDKDIKDENHAKRDN